MSSQTEKKTVTTGQGLLMLAVGIAIIIVGILVLKANNAIVLALDGVVTVSYTHLDVYKRQKDAFFPG